MKFLLLLLLLATVVHLKTYKVHVNETEIQEIVNDFEDFSDRYEETTRQERYELMRKL